MMKTVVQHFQCREGSLDGWLGGREGSCWVAAANCHTHKGGDTTRFNSGILLHPETVVIRAL